jgi:hypothetical protein
MAITWLQKLEEQREFSVVSSLFFFFFFPLSIFSFCWSFSVCFKPWSGGWWVGGWCHHHPFPLTSLLIAEFVVDVDVDWMDPEYAKNMAVVPHDLTSNQILVDSQMRQGCNKDLLFQTARELKDQGWLAIYTRMVCIYIYIYI